MKVAEFIISVFPCIYSKINPFITKKGNKKYKQKKYGTIHIYGESFLPVKASVETGCTLKERNETERRRESGIHVNNAESRYFIVSITKNAFTTVCSSV